MNRKTLAGLIAGGAVLLLAAVLLLVPLAVPTEALRGEIEHRVAGATGRPLKINGALSVSLLPSVRLIARDVTLANMAGGHARDMVHVDAMRIAVRLWPLFSGRIEATEILLDHPRIALEVLRDGTANWELGGRRSAQSGLRVPSATTFAGVTITGGAVSYDNDRLGIRRAIDDLNADVTITKLGLPVSAKGTFSHRGRRLDYTATVATIATLLAGKATKVDVALNADFVHAGFLGFISGDGTAKGSGSLRTPSLKDLAAWLGRPIAAGRGLGNLTALAQVAAKDRRIVLTQLKAKLDDMMLEGALTADTRADIPQVAGTLAVDRLDLNTYLDLGGNSAAKPGAPRAGGPPSGGWSKAPIKLDLIKLLNGQLIIKAGSLAIRHLKFGKTTISVSLADGVMEAHLEPIALYGGSGKAFLIADRRGPVPSFKNKLTFTAIAMKPFLADAIGVDRLDGTGTIMLDVASSGANPDAIMRTLSGKGTVVIANGHVRGVDMGKVARTVQTILSAGATGQSATTAFDRFSGSFAIQRGILWNGDLRLSSAFLNMTGQGHLDLGNQTIAYRIEPKASIGGRLHLFDVGVPFAITGTWAHVRYQPDLAGAVTGLVGGVLQRGTAPVTGLIDRLTGAKPVPEKKPKGVGGTLKDMFGIH